MDYAKDIDKLTGTTSTWKPCYHRKGKWHTVRFWFFKRKYLLCEEWCGRLIREKEVKRSLELYKMLNKEE